MNELKFPVNQNIIDYIRYDAPHNYFILLGLLTEQNPFEKIFEINQNENKGYIFLRKSKNIQLYSQSERLLENLGETLQNLSFNKLISPQSIGEKIQKGFSFKKVEIKGYIASMSQGQFDKGRSYLGEIDFLSSKEYTLKKLDSNDIRYIIELYDKCFTNYPSPTYIQNKLYNRSGRGLGIFKNDRLLAAVQTDFEFMGRCVIVGVATDPEYRGKGLATLLLKILCKTLYDFGIKEIFLQFDNPDAGRIYKSIGFQVVDYIQFYEK